MDNSSLNATEIAVGSLLAGNRGGGYGGGAWGGGYYGRPFADDGTNAVRINRNGQFIENQADYTRDSINSGIDRVANAFENAERARQFSDIRDGQFRLELRTNDRLLALQAEMNANARTAADCCCEVKLNQCKDTAALMAEIKAVESRSTLRDLDRAERELTALKTQVACGCVQGCSTPCPPCGS